MYEKAPKPAGFKPMPYRDLPNTGEKDLGTIYNRKVIEKAIKKALLIKAAEAGYRVTPEMMKAVSGGEMFAIEDVHKRMPIHGVAAPDGSWHEMGPNEEHKEKLAELSWKHENIKESITGGHAGCATIRIRSSVHLDPSHPAVRTMAERIKELPASDSSIEIEDRDSKAAEGAFYAVPRHLAEKGIFKKPSKTQMYRSEAVESSGITGQLEKAKEKPRFLI